MKLSKEKEKQLSLVRRTLSSEWYIKALSKSIEGFDFTYTNKTPAMVIKDIKNQLNRLENGEIRFEAYKSRNPWSRSNGYVEQGQNRVIHINVRKNLNIVSLLGFVIHELSHFAHYGHGTGRCANSMSWYCGGRKKRKSVPVKLASITEELYDGVIL